MFSCDGRHHLIALTDYLDLIRKTAEYDMWYCGHYHVNEQTLDDTRVLYEDIVRIH